MSVPYLGEIRIFAGKVEPRGWMFCQGQTLDIASNESLFQLIGRTYGGDGQSTFCIPDLQGRAPVHFGQAEAGGYYQLGEMGGVETVTLQAEQIPSHNHGFAVTSAIGTQSNPGNNLLANSQGLQPYIDEPPDNDLNPQTLSEVGASSAHNNLQPLTCLNFIISLFGVFPKPSEDTQ